MPDPRKLHLCECQYCDPFGKDGYEEICQFERRVNELEAALARAKQGEDACTSYVLQAWGNESVIVPISSLAAISERAEKAEAEAKQMRTERDHWTQWCKDAEAKLSRVVRGTQMPDPALIARLAELEAERDLKAAVAKRCLEGADHWAEQCLAAETERDRYRQGIEAALAHFPIGDTEVPRILRDALEKELFPPPGDEEYEKGPG